MSTDIDLEKVRKRVGERIKELRKNYGETQKQLAEKISCSENNISKIECGEVSLTFENMLMIAKHYRVSLDYLCKGKEGIEPLDTLNEYIKLNFISMAAISNDDSLHVIPKLTINEQYYNYLKKIARISYDKDIPDNIKKMWIEDATDTFIKEGGQDDEFSIIPIPEAVFYECYTSNDKLVHVLENEEETERLIEEYKERFILIQKSV